VVSRRGTVRRYNHSRTEGGLNCWRRKLPCCTSYRPLDERGVERIVARRKEPLCVRAKSTEPGSSTAGATSPSSLSQCHPEAQRLVLRCSDCGRDDRREPALKGEDELRSGQRKEARFAKAVTPQGDGVRSVKRILAIIPLSSCCRRWQWNRETPRMIGSVKSMISPPYFPA